MVEQFEVEEGIRQLLQGDSYNEVLKRSGRLVYRCFRGCLLGGVIHHAASSTDYFFEWQRTGINDLEIDPLTVVEILNGEPLSRPVPPWVVQYVQELGAIIGYWELQAKLRGDDLALPVERLKDVFAFGIGRNEEGSWTNVYDIKEFDPSDINKQFMNCRHVGFAPHITDVFSHLERVKYQKTKWSGLTVAGLC